MYIYSSFFQAFKLCSTGEDGFNLSYESLTSEKAKKALLERMKNSKDFTDTLSRTGTIGTEEEEEEEEWVTNNGSKVIEYDEIDSSKTVEEEIADLMAGGAVDDLVEDDEVCVGTNLEQYIGYEFSSQTATNAWMKWDTKGSH